jgi:serine/threonine protein kinase
MLFSYICGGELFSRLRKEGRFSLDVTMFYITEILLAMKYLHENSIIYRDLKPENILIEKDGHIKLVDFGFSKKMKFGKTYTLCGTPEYLAPEIIKG